MNTIDPMWFDRDRIDREVKGVDQREISYDPDLGVYCYRGEPFTGVSIQRYEDGKLETVAHMVQGVAHGVTASWHPNGRLALYREMANEVRDGLSAEWAEDGTLLTEARYRKGRPARKKGQAP